MISIISKHHETIVILQHGLIIIDSIKFFSSFVFFWSPLQKGDLIFYITPFLEINRIMILYKILDRP